MAIRAYSGCSRVYELKSVAASDGYLFIDRVPELVQNTARFAATISIIGAIDSVNNGSNDSVGMGFEIIHDGLATIRSDDEIDNLWLSMITHRE